MIYSEQRCLPMYIVHLCWINSIFSRCTINLRAWAIERDRSSASLFRYSFSKGMTWLLSIFVLRAQRVSRVPCPQLMIFLFLWLLLLPKSWIFSGCAKWTLRDWRNNNNSVCVLGESPDPELVVLHINGAQESIPRNEFRQPMYSLAGRYDEPIPPRFLAPIDSLKIPAQNTSIFKGTQDWEFFWLRFLNLLYFFVSYA